jgi:hypothetical protein
MCIVRGTDSVPDDQQIQPLSQATGSITEDDPQYKYVHILTCTHTHTHSITCTCTHTHTHTHTHTCIHTYTHSHTCTNTHTRARTHTCTHTRTHTNIHVHTPHTHRYTHTHTCSHTYPNTHTLRTHPNTYMYTPHYTCRCTKNPWGCICYPRNKPVSQPEICVFDHNPERAPLLQQSTSINSDGDTTSGNEMPYHVYSWYVATTVSRVSGVLHCTIRSQFFTTWALIWCTGHLPCTMKVQA